MVSITVPLENEIFLEISKFPWVNWSEVAREKLIKRKIFEEFIKTGTISSKSQEFCDMIDWYPIDELPLREEYIKKAKESVKNPSSKPMSAEEFKKWCEKL